MGSFIITTRTFSHSVVHIYIYDHYCLSVFPLSVVDCPLALFFVVSVHWLVACVCASVRRAKRHQGKVPTSRMMMEGRSDRHLLTAENDLPTSI